MCTCVCVFCCSEHKQVYMTNMPLVIAYSFKGTVQHQTGNTLLYFLRTWPLTSWRQWNFLISDFALSSQAAGSLHNSAFVPKVLHYIVQKSWKESRSVTQRSVCLHTATRLDAVVRELQQGAEFLTSLNSGLYVFLLYNFLLWKAQIFVLNISNSESNLEINLNLFILACSVRDSRLESPCCPCVWQQTRLPRQTHRLTEASGSE